ncbi:hypothetical protein GUITHDRAFT_87425 [Guillardia theta CCMP2712]|uniref:Anaphase-promoting complex subunit 4 WD40 domain-containing protein n=1 Tax=Guillardia theta (strain CCMP2712) TaxID=905079 RepID=L1J7K6_GUITC|nr:hypothetical protein GUITHDRAFT_87425 [Guillardia theta CCMP2712]EKX44511.1 hypothetical protein GUITHDRAFT_87425 [Guillardia theta CCMP2712]|eukprot:XP_005831491.1 hypothetical protein GUITHDRAFT_87425 [Guillardia theta CCMP2712]
MQALNKPISISPLSSVLVGSRSVIRCSHISDDGSVIVNGSDSGDLYIWDSETSESVMSFQAHKSVVNAVRFLSSSSRILSAASDNTAKIWDEPTTSCIATYKGHSSPVLSLAVSPDEKTFASGAEDMQIHLWNEEATTLHVLKGHEGPVRACDFSPDGLRLASASLDKTCKVWDLESKSEINENPVWIQSMALSPSGTYGVSSSEDGKLCLWDTNKAEMVMRCDCAHVCRVACFPPHSDDVFVAACDDGVIRVFKIPEMLSSGSGSCSMEIGYHDLCIRALKFARDGKRFITGSLDHLAKVWSLDSISQEMSLQGHEGSVLDAEVSPSMNLYVTSSTDKTVRVWNAKSGKEQWQGKHGAYVYACGFSPDNKRAISVSGDRTVRVWTAKKGECLHILKAKSALLTCAISEAGFLLCSGYEGAMHMWDMKAYEAPPLDLVGHDAEIRSLQLSRFGSYALSASNDGSVRIFDCRSGQPLGALPWPFAFTSMSSVVDQERAICMCGDSEGNVLIVRIHGVHDILHRHISHGDSLLSKK